MRDAHVLTFHAIVKLPRPVYGSMMNHKVRADVPTFPAVTIFVSGSSTHVIGTAWTEAFDAYLVGHVSLHIAECLLSNEFCVGWMLSISPGCSDTKNMASAVP